MRKIIFFLFLTFYCVYANEYRAVFDCSSSNERFVLNRLFLIQKTAENFKEDKLNYKFEITMHGGCVLFVKNNLSDFSGKKRVIVQDIQHQLEILKELYGIKIKACNIALSRYNLGRKDIIDFVDIVKNSWQELIILQNKGYALVPFK